MSVLMLLFHFKSLPSILERLYCCCCCYNCLNAFSSGTTIRKNRTFKQSTIKELNVNNAGQCNNKLKDDPAQTKAFLSMQRFETGTFPQLMNAD